MARMDRMIILYLWGMREGRILKRAREQISNKAPREPTVYQNEPGSGHGHVLDYKLGL